MANLWKKGLSYGKVETNMKKLESLPLAQIASFLALLLFFVGYYLSFTLFDFLPPVSGSGGAAMTI